MGVSRCHANHGRLASPPELKLIADPETRRRVAMAAESDLEAFRYAHWRGTVTFHDVAASWFHMSDPNLPDDLRAEFKELFPGLLDAFAEPRKGIITAYFCRHIRVAAALTDIGHAAGAPEGVPEADAQGPAAGRHRRAARARARSRPRATATPTRAPSATAGARARTREQRGARSGAACCPAARTSSTPRPPPARRSTSSRPSATPRTGRPRRSSSSACTCTTRRSSSSPRSRARSACG